MERPNYRRAVKQCIQVWEDIDGFAGPEEVYKDWVDLRRKVFDFIQLQDGFVTDREESFSLIVTMGDTRTWSMYYGQDVVNGIWVQVQPHRKLMMPLLMTGRRRMDLSGHRTTGGDTANWCDRLPMLI